VERAAICIQADAEFRQRLPEHSRNLQLKINMKRITLMMLIGAALALGSFAIAAQKEKTKESKKPAVAPTAEHVVLTPSDLKWVEAPPGLPAGALIAVLEGDPNKKGPFTIRFQMPDGYKIAPHTHPTMEKITVISGTFFLGMGAKFEEEAGHELGTGAFAVMPAQMQHFAWAKGQTIVQIHGEGPFEIKYVNPADDPRQAKH
jgi:quercetin dioxygenase-like cupin family protein